MQISRVNLSPRLARPAAPTSPPAKADTDTDKVVLANRISLGLNLGALTTTVAAGAVGVGLAASTLGLGAVAAGVAATVGGLGALGCALKWMERSGPDIFAPLRTLSKKIAGWVDPHHIKASPSEVKIATNPTLSQEERQQFISSLKPGDIVLDCTADSARFMGILKTFGGSCDFTHAMLYEGNGNVLHSSASGGSHRSGLDEILSHSNRALALRPDYRQGEAEQTVAQATQLLGRPYERWGTLDDKRLGCAEMVYHSLLRAVPQSQMKMYTILGHKYPAPRDFLTLQGVQQVSEVGQGMAFADDLKSAFRT